MIVEHHSSGDCWGGRREACTAQIPRVRREPAPNPFKPPRRSNRTCVAKNSLVGGHSGMAGVEEADESKTEDEYVPGTKSLTFTLAPGRFGVQNRMLALFASVRVCGRAHWPSYLAPSLASLLASFFA